MKTRGKALWAKVHQPDTRWEPQWNITLELSKEEALKLKAEGLRVKETIDKDDNIVRTFKFVRRVKRRDGSGKHNAKPTVVDAALNPFTEIIGNGSDVIVLHRPYTWSNDKGKGKGTDLCGVQIVELVPFVREESEGSSEPAEEMEGFEVIGEGIKTKKTTEDEVFSKPEEEDEEPF